MPSVTLREREIENEALPEVCMRCGAEADELCEHTFYWQPASAQASQLVAAMLYLAGFVVIRLGGGLKEMTVSVPLCARHKKHFLWPSIIQYGGLLVFVLLCALYVLAVANGPDSFDEMRGIRRDGAKILSMIAGSICFAWPLLWLAALVIVGQRGIRATEITDRSITLTNVAEGFAAKVDGK